MLVKDSILYILGRVIPSAVGFLTAMVLTWALSPDEYGVYGLGLAVVTLTTNLFFEWHGITYARYAQANTENDRFLPTVFGLFLALCGLSAVVCAAVALSGLAGEYRLLLWLCLGGTWAYSWFEWAARVQVANFHAAGYFWMNIVRNLLILAGTAAAAWGLHSPLAVLAAAFVAMFAATLGHSPRGLGPLARFDPALTRQMISFGWPIAISMTLVALSGTVFSRFIIEALADTAAVGFFTVSFMIVQNTINVISVGIGTATYPHAVRALESGDGPATERLLRSAATLLLGLTLPAAVGLAMVAPEVARLVVGPAYAQPLAALTPWMAASAVLIGIRANYFDRAFQLGNNNKPQTVVMLVAAAVNILGNVLLIPHFGYLGAGMAATLAAAVALVHAIIAGRAVYVLPWPFTDAAKIAGACAVMAAVLAVLPDGGTTPSLALHIVVGAAVYGVTLVLTGVIDAAALLTSLRRRATGST